MMQNWSLHVRFLDVPKLALDLLQTIMVTDQLSLIQEIIFFSHTNNDKTNQLCFTSDTSTIDTMFCHFCQQFLNILLKGISSMMFILYLTFPHLEDTTK